MHQSIILSTLALTTSIAAADITLDESLLGDFSNDRFNPTFLDFEIGVVTTFNEVHNANNPNTGDRDYFTFTLEEGEAIDSITIISATNLAGGSDSTCFIGLAFDNIFDFDPDAQSGPGLVGYALSNSFNIGQDILPDLSDGLSTLAPGDYSFWIQQTNPDITRLQLEFNVIPTPMTATPLALTGLLAIRRRRT